MPWQVVVQHCASYIHSVGTLADDDTVTWQQLGNVMKHCVVIHRQLRLHCQGLLVRQGKKQWRDASIKTKLLSEMGFRI